MIRSGKNVKGAGRPINARTSELCQVLTALRFEAGLTQETMAVLMCTTKNTVCAWECGRKHPTLTTLEKIAEVTGKRLELRFV